jgi:hypothetical protein
VASFRAALGISPRYGDALIGIAEAYRYQGMKEEALAAYEKYLEHHPSGSKATMARKFVGELKPAEPPPPQDPPPPPPQDPPPPPQDPPPPSELKPLPADPPAPTEGGAPTP